MDAFESAQARAADESGSARDEHVHDDVVLEDEDAGLAVGVDGDLDADADPEVNADADADEDADTDAAAGTGAPMTRRRFRPGSSVCHATKRSAGGRTANRFQTASSSARTRSRAVSGDSLSSAISSVPAASRTR